MKEAIELSLKTWYPKDHPLRLDPRHPAIKLAGEAGEILDLYGKHEYKPGFNWWDCKHCKQSKTAHLEDDLLCEDWQYYDESEAKYTPLILDELGDLWYYLRILAYINKIHDLGNEKYRWAIDKTLAIMAQNCCVILNDTLGNRYIDLSRYKVVYGCLVSILNELDTTIDELTELNYIKLNSEPTNHGWKGA